MKSLRLSLLCVAALCACTGGRTQTTRATSSPPPSPSPSPSVSPTISERGLTYADFRISRAGKVLLALKVEVAETPAAQVRGLMGVERLDENAGMAFITTAPSRGPFYMKNTLIPLDIAFWDTDGAIVDILEMHPCRADPCPLYTPGKRYVGAVETNIGIMARHGVAVGDHAELIRR